MNKLYAVVLTSLAGLGLATGQAAAWCHDCCCSKCCTTICLKQYNAFTPICCGSLCCNGCCPLGFGGFCQQPAPPPMFAGCPSCAAGYGGYKPAAPAPAFNPAPNLGTPGPLMSPGLTTESVPQGAPQGAPPANPAPPTFRAPMPLPQDNAPPAAGPTAQYGAPGTLQYAGYSPAYYPAPASYAPLVPAYYAPAAGMVPYYWNGPAVAVGR